MMMRTTRISIVYFMMVIALLFTSCKMELVDIDNLPAHQMASETEGHFANISPDNLEFGICTSEILLGSSHVSQIFTNHEMSSRKINEISLAYLSISNLSDKTERITNHPDRYEASPHTTDDLTIAFLHQSDGKKRI